MFILLILPLRLYLQLLILTLFPQIQLKVSRRFNYHVVCLNYSHSGMCDWVLWGTTTSLVNNLFWRENKFCSENKKKGLNLFSGDGKRKSNKNGTFRLYTFNTIFLFFKWPLHDLAIFIQCHRSVETLKQVRHPSQKHLHLVVWPWDWFASHFLRIVFICRCFCD